MEEKDTVFFRPMTAGFGQRRTVLRGLALVAGMAMLSAGSHARAEDRYPQRPVSIVVPFSAGGFTDTMARLLAKGLSEEWRVPVIVENRPGAGGNIGAAHVARAAPDGHVLLVANSASNAINQFLYESPGFDAETDFAPVALLARTPNVVVVGRDSGWATVGEVVAAAGATRGGINFGSAGNGTTSHLTGTFFANAAGAALEHVPFRGSSEVMTALQAGTVQVAFDNAVAWAPLIAGGRVRALAVTGAERSELFPGIPTLSEAGFPGVEAYSWFGLAAPAGASPALIARLNADVNRVISSPGFAGALKGAEIVPGSPEAFERYMAAEREKWGRLVEQAGVGVRRDAGAAGRQG